MCVRSCASMCALADAGARADARVRVRRCLCMSERTRACVGAHACAFVGVGSRTFWCAGVRTGVHACAHYACMIYHI